MQRQRCLPGEDTPVDVHTLGRGETEADGIRSSTERVGNVIGNPRNAVNVDGDMQALQRRKKEKGTTQSPTAMERPFQDADSLAELSHLKTV